MTTQKSSQLADSHLTYIGLAAIGATKCAVYPRAGGLSLGTVERQGRVWIARDFDGNEKVAKTRWQAATALWGTWQ